MRVIICLLIFTAILIFSGCNTNAEETNPIQNIPVNIASVKQEYLAIPIERSGILSAQNEAKLSFKIGGYVKKIYSDEGHSVKKGALLASLDLVEITAQVAQAQSAYEKALRDLKRVERLYTDSVVTLEQKQNASTAMKVAEANLEIALFNQRHAQILAPADGTILKKFVEKNELIAAGIPVFYFAPTSQNWIIRIGVSDQELLQLQIGDTAHVYFDSYPDVIFRAKISELARTADRLTGTFEIELTLYNTKFPLVSGFVGTVRIYPSHMHRVFIIPIESLIEADGNQGYVFSWEAQTQKITKTPIKIFSLADDFIAVSAGLDGINQVISKGSSYLTEQSKITIIN
jgi:multidrug efflux system membrane fusion protein